MKTRSTMPVGCEPELGERTRTYADRTVDITTFHNLGAPNPFRPKTDYHRDRNRTRGTVTGRRVSRRAFPDIRNASAN